MVATRWRIGTACAAVAIAVTGNIALLLSGAISWRTFGILELAVMVTAIAGFTLLINKARQNGSIEGGFFRKPSSLRLRMFRAMACLFPALLIFGWIDAFRTNLRGVELVGPIVGSVANLALTYGFIFSAAAEKRRFQNSEGR